MIRRSAAYRNLEQNDATITDTRTPNLVARVKQAAAVACAVLVIVLAAGVTRERTTPTPEERDAVRAEQDRYLESINDNRDAQFEAIYQQAIERRTDK